jgi:tricorn protease
MSGFARSAKTLGCGPIAGCDGPIPIRRLRVDRVWGGFPSTTARIETMHHEPSSHAPFVFAAALLALPAVAQTPAEPTAPTRLLRYPDLHGDFVVFCHGGDLWRAPANGGTAIRLTTHPGEELFPRISPDGRHVAFTGQIDGDEQVYVVPSTGGVPKQLTFYPSRGPLPARWGYDNQVVDWTPDGRAVVFRTLRDGWSTAQSRLYTAPLAGGLATPLPMPVSGIGTLSPDGTKVCYSPLSRDFRTWKRYQGGWAQDLWIYDLGTNDVVQITDHPRTDRDPMWVGESIWFTSDRTDVLNLWRYDIASKTTTQETFSTEWDVRWPASAPDGRIVYEQAGDLYVFAPSTRTATKLAITVPTDDLNRRPSRVDASDRISGMSLSPGGERVAVSARGDVFSAPVEHGPTRNLTRSSGAHDKHASWSPDGKWIAFVSDRSGEEQLWVAAQDGASAPRMVTEEGKAMLYAPNWAPDSASIAISDKDGRLYVVDVETGARVMVADEERGQLHDYSWSPCSRWIAFSLSEPSALRSLHLWSRDDGTTHRVTGPLTHEFAPVFDRKGERLFFLGYREFAPRVGNIEWNYQLDRNTGVFVLALRKDLKPLFPPRSDEVKAASAKSETKDASKSDAKSDTKSDNSDDAKSEPKATRIDLEGLADRVERVPVDADNYTSLDVGDGHLFVTRGASFYYGRGTDRPAEVWTFDIGKRERKTFLENVGGFALSHDGKKLLFAQSGGWFVVDAKPGGEKDRKRIPTSGLVVDRVPEDEWRQIYDEVWRRFRDFFYAENMHGHDWEALGQRYRQLLPYVRHRSDLNYVIGELIGELNAGHAYITGGDWHEPARVPVALPGARFELDADAGRYRIASILRGENDGTKYRSPLTQIGVDARVGDYVLAIDGDELRGDDDPYRLLRGRASHPVTLTLNATPTLDGARKVTFEPITDERDLVYLAWVTRNREAVDKATDGRVGYLHVPDMGAEGIYEFVKWFYPQVRKEGLVVDVRGNGGGNVSQMLIERLRREIMLMTYGRTNGTGTNPNVLFHGHMVCLLNENSASDGDIFPATFRRAGLGKLVGRRSWGGIIGITNRGTLIDGGQVNVPEFANTEPVGAWTIEGVGVTPDIDVQNDPKSVLAGRDLQLEKGIEVVLQAIREQPKTLPARPADPIRR